jgi:acyl-CoA reductase-like NAD-dependent aldehyde dehydrogenase
MKIPSPFNPDFAVEFEMETNVEAKILKSHEKLKEWKTTSLDFRIQLVAKFVEELLKEKDEICEELCNLIGRPLAQNMNEVKGFIARADALLTICKESLKDIVIEDSNEFTKIISREALGVVFIISAWNYPYLISVNGIVPALLAGNTVILKHAPQTFSVGKRFMDAFNRAGLPEGVFQVVYCNHQEAEKILKSPLVNYVHFTGSVKAGKLVNKLVAEGESLAGVGLELGGKDPAYVRADADPEYCAEQLVDGAIYNSGQSCCSIERSD